MIPLYHDFSGKSVVIVGGGAVAARKAERFAAEAAVTVVSETFHPRLRDVDCTRIERSIDPDDVPSLVSGAFLVVPATDDGELNERIETIARDAGCLVNRVDTVGETVTPSVVESESISVAISTSGRSPAVAAYLGDRLEAELRRADGMVSIQSWMRDRLDHPSAAARRTTLRRIVEDPAVWEAIETGDLDRARTIARRKHRTHSRIPVDPEGTASTSRDD